MSDPKGILVYFEGDDDGAILEQLQRADMLPNNLKLIERTKTKGGKDAMVRELAKHVSTKIGGRAIALRDLDNLEIDQVETWFSRRLKEELGDEKSSATVSKRATSHERILVFEVSGGARTGLAAVVPVGLPGESELTTKWGLKEFAMDDYVLRLVCDQGIYEAVSELEGVRYELAFSKLAKTQKLLTENSIPVVQAKRLLHLLRGITGFRASPAVFASRLMEEGLRTIGKEKLADLFEPLLGDIRTATEALSPG